MSEKRKNPRHWQSHTDTILGPGVRVDGSIRFSGVLRTQGEISGDIHANGDGSVVVSKSGSVAGSIEATHIVVCGRVQGNAHAEESVEIQEGASVVGDVSYRRIAIQPGGIVEGALTPKSGPAEPRPAPERARRAAEPAPALPGLVDAAPAGGRSRPRGLWLKIGAAVVLVVAVAVGLSRRHATEAPAPVAEEMPPAPAAQAALAPAPAVEAVAAVKEAPPPPAESKATAPAAAPSPPPEPPPPAKPASKPAAAAPAPLPAPADGAQVVEVQGDNPDKPQQFVYLTSRGPCVLMKRNRQESGEGTRIAVPQGAKKRIAIAPNEILRLAEGNDVDIFYQGRKVARHILQSGAWIGFVPYGGKP